MVTGVVQPRLLLNCEKRGKVHIVFRDGVAYCGWSFATAFSTKLLLESQVELYDGKCLECFERSLSLSLGGFTPWSACRRLGLSRCSA